MTSAQLSTWQSDFGTAWMARGSVSETAIDNRRRALATGLRAVPRPVGSVLEVGAGYGANLTALRGVLDAELFALEPNETGRDRIVSNVLDPDHMVDGSATGIAAGDGKFDLVFTCAVLIHVDPADLLSACREIHRVAGRYILTMEYFAKEPESKVYRGVSDLLFKRDYGLFWLENFADLRPIDYGFFWKPVSGLDDINWWLFEKRDV